MAQALAVFLVHLLDAEHILPLLEAIPVELVPACGRRDDGSGNASKRAEEETE